MSRGLFLFAGLSCLVVFAVSARAVTPAFQGLGLLPGDAANGPHAVSADGSTVVGQRYPDNSFTNWEAYRWTAATGMVALGDFSGGFDKSIAEAVSADGSVAVGHGTTSVAQAARWRSSGIEALPDPSGLRPTDATGISSDGQVIVGSLGSTQAMRWTQATGLVGLGYLSGAPFTSAYGVSGDGNVVVGNSWSTAGYSQAFRWTASGGAIGLGYRPGGSTSYANGASFDGSVVVGSSTSIAGLEAYRWTSTAGMQGLGDLPGGAFTSNAAAVSADGSVVVGNSESVSSSGTGTAQRGFYWRADIGMVDVNVWLPSHFGINLTGWFLGPCTGISADGLTFVGSGRHNGRDESWIATIPEPSSLILASLGAGALLRRPAKQRVH